MENGGGVLREEIAEGDSLVVGAHLNVEAVVALVLAAEMECGRVEAVAHGGTLAVERCPDGVDGGVDRDAVGLEEVHPALRLGESALAERHLPHAVVEVEPRARREDERSGVAVDLICKLAAGLGESNRVAAVGRGYG